MTQTQTKTQNLVDILGPKVAEDTQEFETSHITPEFIRRELAQRERMDALCRAERQEEINLMFPARTKGALYTEETIEFTTFDF